MYAVLFQERARRRRSGWGEALRRHPRRGPSEFPLLLRRRRSGHNVLQASRGARARPFRYSRAASKPRGHTGRDSLSRSVRAKGHLFARRQRRLIVPARDAHSPAGFRSLQTIFQPRISHRHATQGLRAQEHLQFLPASASRRDRHLRQAARARAQAGKF